MSYKFNHLSTAAIEEIYRETFVAEIEVDARNEVARRIRFTDFDQAISLTEGTLEIAIEAGYQKGEADTRENLCWFCMDKTLYVEAEIHAHAALAIYEALDDQVGVAKIIGRKGRLEMYKGNYSESMSLHLRALAIARQISNSYEEAIACNHIGNLYQRLKKPIESLTSYKQAYAGFKQINDKNREAMVLINMGLSYAMLRKFEKATESILDGKALALSQNNLHIHTWACRTLAETYIRQNKYENAKDAILEQLDFARKLEDLQQELDALLLLGELSLEAKQFDDAIHHLNRGRQIASEKGMTPHLYRCHRLLANCYVALDDHKSAFDHLEIYQELKEQVFNTENERTFQSLELAHKAEIAREKAEIYRLQAEDLESKVKARTRELAFANDELARSVAKEAELSDLKSRIIATVSHEFRTPLTVINASTDLLISHFQNLCDEKRGQVHTRIRDAIRYLTDLLQDVQLVDSTNEDQIEFNPKRMLFSQFAGDLEVHFSSVYPKKRIVFHSKGELRETIYVDFDLVKQVAFNLINNAIKYAAKSETPIQVRFVLESNLKISVADQGIGIPQDEIESIWRLFYRATNVSTHRRLGLGLYIVKNLVGKMNGVVSAESEGVNQGATFTIVLPAHPPSTPFAETDPT